MENPVHDRIKRRLEALRLSPRAASLNAGASADLIRTILRREHSQPSAASLRKLAPALKTTEQWLLNGTGPETIGRVELEQNQTENPFSTRPNPGAIVGDVEPITAVDINAIRNSLPQNMPVYGTAAGSLAVRHEGAFEMENRVMEYVLRPPALLTVTSAYAFRVAGSSMEPEHRNDALRFVHPGRQPRQGDSVVIQARYEETGGVEAFIAHFVSMDADKVTVAKLNPAARVIFERRYVVAIHVVMEMNDLFGA